jgi:hypothetical protein
MMNLLDACDGYATVFQSTGIDPSLNGDMRLRFELKISLARVAAIVVVECPLDVDGMRIVAFDQIAVVAIHGPYQVPERCAHTVRQAAPKSG